MAYKTRVQLVADVVARVGLVTGTALQTYAEPQIQVAIQDAFDFVFRKRFWKHLSDWHTKTLDGTAGLFTTDINSIVAAPEDMRDFFVATTDLAIVEPAQNEHLLDSTATTPRFRTWIPFSASTDTYQKKVVKFWPITATGDVTFYARTHPGTFVDASVVPFPSDVIGWAATWLMLESDGLNPAAANKARLMFDIAYKDYIAATADDVIGHKAGGRNAFVTLR